MSSERFEAIAGRLDAVVAALTGTARADVQRAIEDGRVTVDGLQRPKAFRLAGGEILEVAGVSQEDLELGEAPVAVRYEDDDLAIVVKPAGMITHPTNQRRNGTLVNALLGMGMSLAPAGGPLRPGIVHRLDVGTSGLILIAKTDEAIEGLQALLRRHDVDRRYLACVRAAVQMESFAVDAPLGKRATRVVVDRAEGREAATAFEVLERLERATLLEARPRTGRTHQIRVHLAAIGHPILGDRAYGGGGDDALHAGLTRPFLHAARLSFVHPRTGLPVEASDPLPADLAEALGRLRDLASDLHP